MERDYIKKFEEITLTKYEADKCEQMLEELIIEYEKLQESFDDYKQYVEDNYEFKEMR